MANVTGPTSNLPGRRRKPPEGCMCDEHDTVPAVVRMTGETDSFGSEENDFCQLCLDKFDADEPAPNNCDWCKVSAILSPTRDLGESSTGRVYYVCPACAVENVTFNSD